MGAKNVKFGKSSREKLKYIFRVWSSEICGGQSGAGAGFLRVLRFSLPIFIPPNFPSSQSPGAGKIGQ
jgi:hypothetical protein